MRKSISAVLAAGLLVTACGSEQVPVDSQAESADVATTLNKVFDEFFERELALNPLQATSIGDDRFNDRLANSIGPQHIEASRILDEEFLGRLLEIDRTQLASQDQLSYDMFKLNRQQSLEGHRFPGHLQPINQFSSMLNFFVVLGSGSSLHPFKTVKDYDDWLSRIDGFVEYTDQVIENTKQGMQQGVVRPRILVAKAVPQIQSQIVDSAKESGFYTPIENMPDEFGDEDRERLSAAYEEAIEGKIIPAYERLSNFVGDEYLDSAREMGVYSDPMELFGSLNAELWRSIRLVVDTGLHAKGWTRQQVLDYMFENSAVSETRAVSEAERFMAIPGQALAYKIGQLKIIEIRRNAEAALGDNFDVAEFHAQVLMDGSMPLSTLEDKIGRWVAAQ